MKKVNISGVEVSILFVDEKLVNKNAGNYYTIEKYSVSPDEDLLFETDGQIFETEDFLFDGYTEKHEFIVRNFSYVLYYDALMKEYTLEARRNYSKFDVEKSMEKLMSRIMSRISENYVDVTCFNCTHECSDGTCGCCMTTEEYENWNGLCSYKG